MSNSIAQSKSKKELRSVLDSPIQFSGFTGDTMGIKSIKEIRIGLFFPVDSLDKTKNHLINAAELAIREINERGGYDGIPYRLINRWSNDPWGAGSKEMIKLVYKDSVWAVIGSIDGEVTHIAEQIITKAWVPLLSPISADPTLNYIRIPWIFRLPPDFKVQSELLVNQSIKSGRMKDIGLIIESSHDGRVFFEELNDVLCNYHMSPIFYFQVAKDEFDIQFIVNHMNSFSASSIILYLSNKNIVKLLRALETDAQRLTVLIPWIPGLDQNLFAQSFKVDLYFIQPFLRSPNRAYEKFADEFYRNFGSMPTFGAAYTYDAVYILARALQKSGLNRIRLREAISTMSDFQGVTGKVSWDNAGSNIVQPVYQKLPGGLTE